MQLPPDLHCHSTLSFDGRDTLLDLARKARALGLPGLAVTEHLEFAPDSNAHGWYDHLRIVRSVEEARAEVPELRLWLGVEVGWDPRYAADIRDFLKVHAFDYVLGALHAVDGLDVGPALFEGRTLSEASALYLNAATVAVKTGLFDALAHIDLPKRYGLAHYRQGWDAQACRAETEALFEAMVETGTVLEVNTSGLRQAPKETLPGPEALEWYRALGGRRVVLGSDAHTCGHLGHGFAETAAALKALGLEVLGAPPGRSRP